MKTPDLSSVDYFRSLVETIPGIVYTAALEYPYAITYVSPRIKEILGYSPERLTSDPFGGLRIIHPADRDRLIEGTRKIRGAADSLVFEYRVIAADGRTVWFRDEVRVVGDEAGRPAALQGVMFDITERKLMEESVREAELQFRVLVESSAEAVLVFQDDAIKFANRRSEAMSGYSPEEALGMKPMDFVHPDDRGWIADLAKKRSAGDATPFKFDFRLIRKDGGIVWLHANSVICPWQGRPAILCMMEDVTASKEAEWALERRVESERIVGDISVRFINLELNDIDDEINAALAQIGVFAGADRGYVFLPCPDGLTMRNTHEWCAEGIKSHIRELRSLNMEREIPWFGERIRNLEVVNLSEGEDWAEMPEDQRSHFYSQGIQSLLVAPMAFRNALIGFLGFDSVRTRRNWTCEDVSLLECLGRTLAQALMRKTAAEALRESEERFRNLAEMMPQPVFETDAKGRITFAGNKLWDVLGYGPQDLDKGLPALRFFTPHERRTAAARVLCVLRGDVSAPMETVARRKDGSPFPAIVSMGPIVSGDKVVGLRGIIVDVTERKKTEEILRQTDRYRAVADIAAGVAHNFNNFLQIVMGNSALALMRLESSEIGKAETNLREIMRWAESAAETVTKLNRFSLAQSPSVKRPDEIFDLSEVVKQAVELTLPAWKIEPESRGLKVVMKCDLAERCMVKGNKNDLFGVAAHLIRNAAESLGTGGSIRVAVFVRGRRVHLVVEDTGIGIAQENIDRLFTPFFTTKMDMGAGLGLPTSLVVVRRHDGELKVESVVGEGSQFTLTLPYAQDEESEPAAEEEWTPTQARSILVVDDMEAVALMVKEGLEKHGHSVFTALNARAGLQLLKQTLVDAIICDLGMPDMDGKLMAEAVTNHYRQSGLKRPPFILLTGWGAQIDDRGGLERAGVDLVIEKPVRIASLAKAVDEAFLIQSER
jgi:PAS domain S-box-containing protein